MDCYGILGVSRDAKPEEIRSAYRRLALQSHPDVSGHQDAARFHEIQQAYETLSETTSRARYDRSLETRIPVRIVSSANTARHAEPLIPPCRFAETFAPQSRGIQHEPFEEIFSLMERLFFRF